jgi:hypothetical protein
MIFDREHNRLTELINRPTKIYTCFVPIPVAARSKARTVSDHSNAGIAGSNPAQVCVSSFFCVVLPCVGRGLASG